MPLFESAGPISRSEFEAWEPHRARPYQLVIGELFVAHMVFAKPIEDHHAAKFPTQIMNVEPHRAGTYAVTFILKNEEDPELDVECDVVLQDARWHNTHPETDNLSVLGVDVRRGYFKSEPEPQHDPFMQLTSMLHATQPATRELVRI